MIGTIYKISVKVYLWVPTKRLLLVNWKYSKVITDNGIAHFGEMSEQDIKSILDATTTKEDQNPDPLVEPEPEPLPDDDQSVCNSDNFGPPLLDHDVGPEDGLFRVSFRVVKLQFQFQRITKENRSWVVRANTRGEMLDTLWNLSRPYVRRAVEFPAPNDPCWSEKEVPERMDLPSYLLIRDNSAKRSFKLDQIDDDKWRKWTVQSNLMLIIYLHGHQVHSRAAWDLVVDRLLKPGATPKKPALVGEELKLDMMIKRLKRLHTTKLVPKSEDAFEKWARWILKAPSKRHSSLSMSMPPGELLKNFVPIKQANGRDGSQRRPPSKRTRTQLISGPAQREHTTDGFGFEDEVKILRQTVTQIRDLVEMLDHRVGLLEEKCQGFKQAVQNGQRAPPTQPPKKKARKQEDDEESDSEDSEQEDDEEENAGFDDEPLVNEEAEGDSDGGENGQDWVNPDPLLFNDMVEVKEESLEC